MARISTPKYFVRIDTYWQNSPDYFVGPFNSREDAEQAIENIPAGANVWLSTSTCGGDIRSAVRVFPTVLTATEAKRNGMRDDYGSRHNVIPTMPHDANDLFTYFEQM